MGELSASFLEKPGGGWFLGLGNRFPCVFSIGDIPVMKVLYGELYLNHSPAPALFLFSEYERRESIRSRFALLTFGSGREIPPQSLEERIVLGQLASFFLLVRFCLSFFL